MKLTHHALGFRGEKKPFVFLGASAGISAITMPLCFFRAGPALTVPSTVTSAFRLQAFNFFGAVVALVFLFLKAGSLDGWDKSITETRSTTFETPEFSTSIPRVEGVNEGAVTLDGLTTGRVAAGGVAVENVVGVARGNSVLWLVSEVMLPNGGEKSMKSWLGGLEGLFVFAFRGLLLCNFEGDFGGLSSSIISLSMPHPSSPPGCSLRRASPAMENSMKRSCFDWEARIASKIKYACSWDILTGLRFGNDESESSAMYIKRWGSDIASHGIPIASNSELWTARSKGNLVIWQWHI